MNDSSIRLAVITLGCPKNTADTESVLAQLPDSIRMVNPSEAEVILLNTCAFLKTARDEVFRHVKAIPNKKVILMGCMTSLLKETVFKQYPQIHAVISGFHYPEIARIITEAAQGARIFASSPEPAKYVELRGKLLITPSSHAYLKIAEGCDNACHFCLIPTLKGKYRSRRMEHIVAEAKELIRLGTKELILVAQDSGYYGVDLYGKKRLSDLLKQISDLKGDFWIRVLYVYPERVDETLLKTMAKNPKICRYLDMPLQHGDPDILKKMGRPWNPNRTLKNLERIRSVMPDITLRTSLITGFPGETEKHFQNLMDFVEAVQFDHVGVFEYSREKGTKAYAMKGQIPKKEKKARRERVMALQQKISLAKNQNLIGQTRRVLIEGYDAQKKHYLGRDSRHAPDIDGTLFVTSKKPLSVNRFYEVRIEKAEAYDLFGTVS